MYYCPECDRYHRKDSKIGKKHLKYLKTCNPRFDYNIYLIPFYGKLPSKQREAIVTIFQVLQNPPPKLSPAVRELFKQIAEKIITLTKRGAPLAKKTIEKLVEALALTAKELPKVFAKIREVTRPTDKTIRELTEVMNWLYESGLLDLTLPKQKGKRMKILRELIKYGFIDPELLRRIIEKKLIKS